jgi:hypothetical protein
MEKQKTGHGVGAGSVSISTSVDEKIMEQIDALAARSGLTRGGWARAALTYAAEESACFTKSFTKTFTKTTDQGKGQAQSPPIGPIPQKQKHATG